ncbi:MAG: transporter substrate-binding domain-containing protein [Pseudomonadota bacterium]|nr:transporter substrate-binding domain-containing protein [Pseudomonadota bacterium]
MRADDDDEAPAAAANADPSGKPGTPRAPKAEAAPAAADPVLIGDDGTPADALATVQARHTLRVAVYRRFAPFHEDGQGGIDDDIAKELAHRLGVQVAVQSYMAADEMGDDFRNAIWKGHYMGMPVCDVMLHVPVDEALSKASPQVSIFGTYASEQTVVGYDGEQLSDWKGMESLGSLRAGVETESMPDLYMASLGGQYRSQVEHFPDLAEAVKAMKQGQLQVVIGSRTKLESALGGNSDGRYRTAHFNASVYGRALDLGMAVRKGEVRLQTALAEAVAAMRQDGSFQRIYAQHSASWVAPGQ